MKASLGEWEWTSEVDVGKFGQDVLLFLVVGPLIFFYIYLAILSEIFLILNFRMDNENLENFIQVKSWDA